MCDTGHTEATISKQCKMSQYYAISIMLCTSLLIKATIDPMMADVFISEVADVVTNLDEDDEQTGENAVLIAGVFNQIDNLIEEGALNVSTSVSIVSRFVLKHINK